MKRTKKGSLSQRLVLSLAALSTAGAIAGMGAFGSYTSTQSATETVTAGTVAISLGAINTPANRLTTNATNVVPGDTINRAVDLASTSSDSLSAVTLTTTATTSSLLDTDATNGLQVVIQSCAAGWVEAGSSPAYTYTCSGGAISVLTTRAVIGANLTLNNLNATTTSSSTDHLLVTLTLGMVSLFLPVPVLVLGTLVVVVQVMVFCLLTSIYIALATEHDEHEGAKSSHAVGASHAAGAGF